VRLLGVFAHPDDESLAAGGLIARHTAAGGRADVVTTTWAPGTGRAAELAAALRLLGAGEPRLLGYADARVPESAPGCPRLLDVPLDEAVDRLAAHIDEVRPEIVVTHDGHGGLTGHPDHERTHRITALAVAASVWRAGELWLATHPQSAVAPLLDLVGGRRAVHSSPDEQVDLALDVEPWLAAKVAAVLAHASEVERGALPGVVARLSPADRARLLGTEWYIGRTLER
jgi:N-acetyl-1-D-myo-inositol-2-amino-2-deoxy-alpha-D-glucopyranoside deacetylase